MNSAPRQQPWPVGPTAVTRRVNTVSEQCIKAYAANPLLVDEHVNIEISIHEGGYERRQLYELVQNGADELLGYEGGRIHVLLTNKALYCANEGNPLSVEGVDAILSSHLSVKRGDEIGRFGLGFKSVLRVTDAPEIYSRSGSFRFDPEESQARIRAVVPGADRAAKLRIALAAERDEACRNDAVLEELTAWAATVIKLPRSRPEKDGLGRQMAEFPPEFLIFSPHVGQLTLEDRTARSRREFQVQKLGEDILLDIREGNECRHSSWRVFRATHRPSSDAKANAGELANRDTLPLIWAVPVEGRQVRERGQFWAFFPTEYYTTLKGFVNAPWKVNEDRQNLLKGTFNEELLWVAARLVAKNVVRLGTPDDPCSFFELMPARGREAPNWADEQVTRQVYEEAAKLECIPDQEGVLRYPNEVLLHPPVPGEALACWTGYAGRPKNWCHQSVDATKDRRSRVVRLLSPLPVPGDVQGSRTVDGVEQPLAKWLEALVSVGVPSASIAAIRTAAAIFAHPMTEQRQKDQVRDARIVLTETGDLVEPRSESVFVPRGDGKAIPNVPVVHRDIGADADARSALQMLGIREVDASSELEAILADYSPTEFETGDWDYFWQLTRGIPVERTVELIRKLVEEDPEAVIRVKDAQGQYQPIRRLLLPGAIVAGKGTDQEATVDTEAHEADLNLLRALGATDAPQPGKGSRGEGWFAAYRSEAIRRFYGSLPSSSSRPYEHLIDLDDVPFAGPMEPLLRLSDEGRIRFTAASLLAARDEGTHRIGHTTQGHRYSPIAVESPVTWLLRREGRLRTAVGVARPEAALSPTLATSAAEGFLPIADCSHEEAERLLLRASLEEVTDAEWQTALGHAACSPDLPRVAAFYAEACRHTAAPALVRCLTGDAMCNEPPTKVAVTADEGTAALLRGLAHPYLLTSRAADAECLFEKWGLVPGACLVSVEVRGEESGTGIPVVDRFPALAHHLNETAAETLLMPYKVLRQETVTGRGKESQDVEVALTDGKLAYLDTLPVERILDAVLHLLKVELSTTERQQILEGGRLADQRKRIAEVRQQHGAAAKLLAAIGHEAIRRRLPAGLVTAAGERPGHHLDALRIAELAHAVYGVELLKVFRDELAEAKFPVPVQWAGTHRARMFVTELGLPPEYAGFSEGRRDPTLDVDGPPHLPHLHEFQKAVVKNIQALFDQPTARRGLLSLPTGAGKTRVAVEALVRLARDRKLSGPILWTAQSDELCEQAVQAWSEVWRSIGPQNTLRVSRLWADNEADPFTEGLHLVVATIQKLTRLSNDLAYDWLKHTACLVIDEAHAATESSYSDLLRWQGLDTTVRTGSKAQDRCPLIGLTATPFRGGEEQTERLAARFGHLRLDRDALGHDPYGELQDMEVLSLAEHEILGGVSLELSDEERERIKTLRYLPPTAGDRLGGNVDRNRSLLESIATRPNNWPILLFCVSVGHAQMMAALLSDQGIPAAAVSAETDAGARRHYIRQFREGKIRVLTNFGVLTTGFDAPKVRAVFIARPVFSAGLYQQMVGRGLRGVLNGGTSKCLIVNVEDTFQQFGEELAFKQFDHLWTRR